MTGTLIALIGVAAAAFAALTALIIVVGGIALLQRAHNRQRIDVGGHTCKRTNSIRNPDVYECVNCGETHNQFHKDNFSEECEFAK